MDKHKNNIVYIVHIHTIRHYMVFNRFISVVSTGTELQRSGALREGQWEDKHAVDSTKQPFSRTCSRAWIYCDRILFLSSNCDSNIFDVQSSRPPKVWIKSKCFFYTVILLCDASKNLSVAKCVNNINTLVRVIIMLSFNSLAVDKKSDLTATTSIMSLKEFGWCFGF